MKRRQFLQACGILPFAGLLPSPARASETLVFGLRLWPAPDHTRLVLDLSGPVEYRIDQGARALTLFLANADSFLALDAELPEDPRLRNVHGKSSAQGLTLTLTLESEVRPEAFLLIPQGDFGHRLVLDLYGKAAEQPEPAPKPTPSKARTIRVAIDAGHGGEDPGAIGAKKTREKDIVLSIAKRVAKRVNALPGYEARLIRAGDYYISLGGRMRKARQLNADLFVSIHADAFTNSKARGASVFILSERGKSSSSFARWLAESENRADAIGGVSKREQDDQVSLALFDMETTANKAANQSLGGFLVNELEKVTRLHGKKQVQRARFAVLKSSTIPSALVETGFITNREEEKKLRTSAHQDKIATALTRGIQNFFKKHPIG
jgi:N-acetylmuramoyl-L-alanine amidase